MAKAIVPIKDFDASNLPAIFGAYDESEYDNLAAGVLSSFAILSFRGKVWRGRYQGDERALVDKDDEPLTKILAVFAGSSPRISKAFYEHNYQSGSDAPPDCFSNDGIRPDASVADPQNDLCATCPKNQFGSAVTDNGSKGKACSDTRRTAVVPAEDLENIAYGGPMLLRIPPMSLDNFKKLGAELKSRRIPLSAAVVQIGFDRETEYPLLTFRLVGVVQSEEAAQTILEHAKAEVTQEILAGRTTVPTAATPVPTEKAAEAEPEAKQARPPADEAKGASPRQHKAQASTKGAAKANGAEKAKPKAAADEDLNGLFDGMDEDENPAPKEARKEEKPKATKETKAAPAAELPEGSELDEGSPGEVVDASADDELGSLLGDLD